MVTRLPVDEAARVLGLSQPTIKRRLKSGALRGVQERTASGFKWYVIVDTPAIPPDVPSEIAPGIAGDVPHEVADEIPPATPQMALETMRAAGMAQYTRELLGPLHAQLKEQAEEIGTLKERTAHLEAELRQERLSRRRDNEDAAPEWPERRSWWQRLVWG